MALLNEKVKQQVQGLLTPLTHPVKLIVFTQEFECKTCADNRALIEEVTSASEKLGIEVYNFTTDRDKVALYNIDKIPATVVEAGGKDYGIRFYGIPGGYEFSSLLHAI